MTEPALRTSSVSDAAPPAVALVPEPEHRSERTATDARRTRPSKAERKADEQAGRGAVKFSLIVSAVRCTITYLLLPAWAPLSAAGVASFMRPVEMILHVVAIVSVAYGVRRFWRSGHRFKWYYLALAVTVTFISLVAIAQYLVE